MRLGCITGRAHHYHLILTQQKNIIRWGKLALARAEEDLEVVFENVPNYKHSDFRRLFPLMLTVIRERKFPKGNIDAQIRFLADSLAGDGTVSPRTARDICSRERNRPPEPKILRRESWVVCECGYRGISFYNECPDCLTRNPSKLEALLSEERQAQIWGFRPSPGF